VRISEDGVRRRGAGPRGDRLRDRLGVRWRRDAGLCWADVSHTGEDGEPYEDYRTWAEILGRVSLTDASRELTGRNV
jgi:hypothetical protein